MYTIFISHNSKDKPVVEPIAIKLAEIFGQDEVFYDSWSIKPGDGIIDKMNLGLENCRFVFFFVSINSISSYMVSLEWQNAIMKASRGQAKLIPVRIDNCQFPALLLQTLYIDLYSHGLEISLRQMVDLIKGENEFHPLYTKIKNLTSSFLNKSSKEVTIELRSNYFMEPTPHFVFVTPNEENEISYSIKDVSFMRCGFNKQAVTMANQIRLNAIRIDLPDALVPGFPQQIIFKATTDKSICILSVMHEESKNKWVPL